MPDCHGCNRSFYIDPGFEDVTGLCHPCAQDEVILLRARVAELEEITLDMAKAMNQLDRAKAARAEIMSRRKWNRVGLFEAEKKLEAAHRNYGKAKAALVRGRKESQTCVCPVAFGGCPVHDKED